MLFEGVCYNSNKRDLMWFAIVETRQTYNQTTTIRVAITEFSWQNKPVLSVATYISLLRGPASFPDRLGVEKQVDRHEYSMDRLAD